jgi:hypothetical protein
MTEYIVYCYRVVRSTRRRWHPIAIVDAQNKDEAVRLVYYYSKVCSVDFLKAKPTSQVSQRDIDKIYIGSLRYPVPQKDRHPQIIASFDF